jgi:hypothetical protein
MINDLRLCVRLLIITGIVSQIMACFMGFNKLVSKLLRYTHVAIVLKPSWQTAPIKSILRFANPVFFHIVMIQPVIGNFFAYAIRNVIRKEEEYGICYGIINPKHCVYLVSAYRSVHE